MGSEGAMKTLITLFALLSACPLALTAASTRTSVRSYSVSRDTTLVLEANAANIRIEPTTGKKLQLFVTEPTCCDHLAQVDMTVTHSAHQLSINAAALDPRYADTVLLIQVPRGISVTVRDAHGDVAIGRISAPVNVETQAGDIVLAQRTPQDHVLAKTGQVVVGEKAFAATRL